MAAVINTNLASLFAQNSLNNAQNNLATSVQRLSSGLRINSAADDASGLSIAQTMAGHIKSLDQAALNAQQAINLAQTADTSLSTVQDILLRMQQLSVQGANGSLSNSQRGAIVTELGVLNTQINSFAAGTTYNGIQLLGGRDSTRDGSSTVIAGDVGTGLAAGASATVSALNVTGAAAGTYTISNSSGVLTLGDGTKSQSVTLTALAAAGDSQTVNFSNLGISFTLTASAATSTAAGMGTGLDSDTLVVTAGSASTLSFQIGASPTASGDSISISTNNINTINSDLTSLTDVGFSITNNFSNTGLNYLSANSASATDALWNTAFTTLNGAVSTAINDISSTRATLGAQMNQLGFINTTVQAQSANEQAARSTVVDTNYSAETASLTKGQIMQQAATAMLAQANQMPNVILSLLK